MPKITIFFGKRSRLTVRESSAEKRVKKKILEKEKGSHMLHLCMKSKRCMSSKDDPMMWFPYFLSLVCRCLFD